jgi:hypothetical protein
MSLGTPEPSEYAAEKMAPLRAGPRLGCGRSWSENAPRSLSCERQVIRGSTIAH